MLYKKISFSLFLIFNIFCFSQQKREIISIDSLLSLSDSYINVDFIKSASFAEQALVKAKEINDSHRKAESYYYISKSLVFFRDFEKSSKYLEKGLQEDAVKNDILLQALFTDLQASYYSRMSLFEQSLQCHKKELSFLKSRNDLESKILSANIYTYIADYYSEMKDYESAHLYADKSIAAIEKISPKQYHSVKRIYKDKAFIYFYKSWIFLEQKKPHQAYPFIQKAYNQAVFEKIDYLALFYEIYGDYYYLTSDYKKAIDFYKKAVENKEKFGQHSAYVDSKIAKSYKSLGDDKNEKYYLEKSEKRQKIDLLEYNATVQKELDRILARENAEKKDIKKNNYIIVAIVVFIFIILLVFVILRYQKIREKKRKIIGKQQIKLSEKETEIVNRKIEIEKLQQKVYESFSELNNLIKENPLKFWGRFQELHPDFVQKLLKINPTLKVSELTFCAYIYLGFTTKEIAEYSFRSIRTIENNRYNLRKKLWLIPEEDFTLWMKSYIDNP